MQQLIEQVQGMRCEVAALAQHFSQKAKPVLRDLKKPEIDPNFNAQAWGGETGAWLELVEKMLDSYIKPPSLSQADFDLMGDQGDPTNSMIGAFDGDIGRCATYYFTPLDLAARAFGAPWARLEAKRLMTLMLPNLKTKTFKVGGKTLKVRMANYRSTTERGDQASKSDNNPKEKMLWLRQVINATHVLWTNLHLFPEDGELVAELLELVQLNSLYWRQLVPEQGVDRKYHTLPIDRTIHALAAYAEGNALMAEMKPDPDERKLYARSRDWALQQLERDMMPLNVPGIGWCITHAYNALGATAGEPTASSVQPSCYTHLLSLLFLKLGMMGLGIFATAEFQHRYSNSMYMQMTGGPFDYRAKSRDGKSYIDGKAEVANFILPADMLWLDTENKKNPGPYQFENGDEKRALRIYDAVEHFRSYRYVAVAGMGAGMAFSSDEFAEFARKNIVGTPDKPKVSQHRTGFPVGMALHAAGVGF